MSFMTSGGSQQGRWSVNCTGQGGGLLEAGMAFAWSAELTPAVLWLPAPLQLSSRLGVTSFPYVALLNTTPGNQVQLVAHVQVRWPHWRLAVRMHSLALTSSLPPFSSRHARCTDVTLPNHWSAAVPLRATHLFRC